ncbi:5,10-methenyltetrahydrofolate synthetase [Salinihabitans flavidus]|uniref:5-formyltetrahydrofolate cyclo-ligase n=1 Tax=Salinihabitans flavidus TaxID=569882 RepID=A0A1H8TMV5_9RHOB|nr:5-formyltetrahydrofolate cyclo-ligase [Salinihabitans flavidus]SEO91944.1 5,10-methenyltetrahydrofolate synthetase [Salinihabitans flavidus]
MSHNETSKRGYASPPCLAAEVTPGYFGPGGSDPQQAVDVARWRKAERKRLLDHRNAQSVAGRGRVAEVLVAHLDQLLSDRCGDVSGRVISGYWPIKAEPDLRPWLGALHARGARIALPVVERRATPLVFRAWAPGETMIRGHWNIPVPAPEAKALVPEIVLAPLVGWDDSGYRLGYGGGYFDRTLAVLDPRPLVIGVGVQAARLATIYPQPHDIPMAAIVTEAGVQVEPAA